MTNDDAVRKLVALISDGNANIFGNRHNWLSPLTSDEERKAFISRYCNWWNHAVCPAMDALGATWNGKTQRFEL